MSDDLDVRVQALAARVAAGLGGWIHMPYADAKVFVEGVLRTQVLHATRAPQAPRDASEGGSEGEVGGEGHEATEGRTELRERVVEALTREHYKRVQERIEASPEDHSAAFADAVLEVVQPELDRERLERVREMHDRTCNLRQAVRQHPEGTFTGVTCEMCDVLDLTPATPGDAE